MHRAFTAALMIAAVATLVLTGCNDEPGPLGIRLLPPGDSIAVETSSTTVSTDLPVLYRINGASTTLLTGVNSGLEARTLLGFGGISAIPATDILDSATLTLRINYRFLDSTGSLAFDVHKMVAAFNPTTFRWDSSTAPGAYSDTVSGRFLRTISPLDTTITLSIDTILVRQWIAKDAGSMILIPQGNIIAGFSFTVNALFDFRPLLSVYYHDTSNAAAVLGRRASWGIFVADGNTTPPADRISLQAGVCTRDIVRFDSLPLPALSSVTAATFQLALDTVQSLINNFTVDKIDVYLVRSASFPYDTLILGTSLTPVYENGQKVYRGDVRYLIQLWRLHEVNRGMILRASGEQVTVDRFVLYGPNAPEALKPRLSVTYTVIP